MSLVYLHGRFTGLTDINSFTYDYNPCVPFTGKEDCAKVQVMKSKDIVVVTWGGGHQCLSYDHTHFS